MSGHTCAACAEPLPPSKRHKRFCSSACRAEHHRSGVQGLIHQVIVTRDGGLSVTVRLQPVDRAGAGKLVPGRLCKIILNEC